MAKQSNPVDLGPEPEGAPSTAHIALHFLHDFIEDRVMDDGTWAIHDKEQLEFAQTAALARIHRRRGSG